MAARNKTDVKIEVIIAEDNGNPIWQYAIGFTQKGGGIADLKAEIQYERVADLRQDKVLISRPDENDTNDPELLKYTRLEQPSTNKDFREIADFLKDIQYLHVLPQLLRDPKSFVNASDKEDFFGRDFLERLNKTTLKKRNAYLRRIESALKAALPNLTRLSFLNDKMGVPHLEAEFKHWRGIDAKQQEDQFSDGTLRFIGLFWALQDGNKPLLLEEPELSLHTAIITRLPEIIYKLQKKKTGRRQVILTTHSYELLDNKGIAGEEVLMLEPNQEGTTVSLAVARPDIKLLLNTGQSVAGAAMARTASKSVDQLTLNL